MIQPVAYVMAVPKEDDLVKGEGGYEPGEDSQPAHDIDPPGSQSMDVSQLNQKNAEVEQVQVNQRKVVGPLTNRPHKRKSSPKKSSGDGLVGVMERFVKIKEQKAIHEATQDFSITKCIEALRTLEGFDASEKPKAFAVFKNDKYCEIFLNAVDDKDGSALIWLRIEMDNLT